MQDESNAGKGEGRPNPALSRAEEIAWAAGLFEGEGCWNAYRHKGKSPQLQVRLAMTDADVVERFAAIVGCGRVHSVPRKRAHEKPLTEWYVYRRAHIRRIIEMFMPFLGDRRRARAIELLAFGEAVHAGERSHCPKGHPYVGENLVLEPIMRDGRRYYARRCKICRADQARERARKRRARVRGQLDER